MKHTIKSREKAEDIADKLLSKLVKGLPKYQTAEAFPFPERADRWDMTTFREETELRFKYTEIGMYAFVSKQWVKPLSEWIGKRKVLEVMSGAGYLALALKEYGVDIIATDNYSWINRKKWDTVTEVIAIDAVKAISEYGRDVEIVIMSWPYMDEVAVNVLKEIKKINPELLILYIGEDEGGCTANDDFFSHFKQIADKDFDKAAFKYRAWQGINDYPQLGKINF